MRKVLSDELPAGQVLPSLKEVTSRQSIQSVENDSALEEMNWLEQCCQYHRLVEAIYSAGKNNNIENEKKVEKLLYSGAPLVSPGSIYNSPLHLAITYNLLNILRRLLDNGASLTAKHFGLVPFQVAWRATGVTSEVSNCITRAGAAPTLRTVAAPQPFMPPCKQEIRHCTCACQRHESKPFLADDAGRRPIDILPPLEDNF
nr:uncharacterized protein LOC128689010 [Cherax quadricarinatus]